MINIIEVRKIQSLIYKLCSKIKAVHVYTSNDIIQHTYAVEGSDFTTTLNIKF